MILEKMHSTETIFYLILYILFLDENCIVVATLDYCKLPCINKNSIVEHVMCSLKNDCSVGPECKVKTKFNLRREMKEYILNMHNIYRNKVALGEAVGKDDINLPQGSDLLEMVWDDELAYFAQCYANKCILQYDKCRQNSARENIGQLIFIKITVNPKTTEEIIMEMIESAFYSSQHLSRREIEKHKNNELTEQFTQLSWSTTNRLGCGVTRLLEDLYAYFMVCNYGPGGNIEGERVYNIGSPCSRCPHHRICGAQYNGLCAAVDDERNGLESIPSFLTTLERVVDPSLQQNEGARYLTNDRNKELNTIHINSTNRKTMKGSIKDSNKSITAPNIKQIPIRLCQVNRKIEGQDFNEYTGDSSTFEPHGNVLYVVIMTLLCNTFLLYNIS